jgi:type IV pilus assembly protein PilV
MSMKKIPMKTKRFHKLQRGLSLIESLIALVVLAVGVMGLAGLQARMLVESRTANHRAVAIGFIDDLSNRMLLNRDAAMANSYALAWNGTKAKKDCTHMHPAQEPTWPNPTSTSGGWRCEQPCPMPMPESFRQPQTPARLVSRWLGLPMNAHRCQVQRSFRSTTKNKSGTNCPANSICHVVYVQP